MDGITHEIRNKIKCAVKAKLQEMEAYVDEELPDYIMVMIANRRSKAQMKSELSLFLGNSTDSFTDWLHSVLERLEAFAVSNNTADKLKEAVSNIPKTGNSFPATAEDGHSTSLVHPENLTQTNMPVLIKKEVVTEDLNISSGNPEVTGISMATYEIQGNSLVEEMEEDCLNVAEAPEQQVQEDELSTNRSSRHTANFGFNKRHGNRLDERISKKPRREENSRHRGYDGRVQSRIFSVVRPILSQSKSKLPKDDRGKTAKDEEYDGQQRSNMNSVVRVTSRRKLPASLQPTKTLILKAVADAQKSIIANPPKVLATEEKPMPALYTRKYRERQQKTGAALSNTDDIMQQLQDTSEMEVDELVIPGISRLEPPVRQPPLVVEEELEPYEEKSDERPSQLLDVPQIEPRFIVTLDGAHAVLGRKFDEASVEDDEVDINDAPAGKKSIKSRLFRRRSTGTEGDVTKPLERCKYWPSCRQGDSCPFHHPKTPCKLFPNCTYGEGCLFLHPQCKFDSACTRKTCPFSHTLRPKPGPAMIAYPAKTSTATIINGKTVCKFYPSCNNVSCTYFHPPACKYGVNCTRLGCTFYHPSAFPAKNKLKWIQTTS